MAWFFVQVWVLCVIAFLLGAAVTWLVFVRPLRRAAGGAAETSGWSALPAWPAAGTGVGPSAPVAPEPPAGPATDPALSALDAPGVARTRAGGVGAAATGALDRLGVGPTVPAQAGPTGALDHPDIPVQPGPADR